VKNQWTMASIECKSYPRIALGYFRFPLAGHQPEETQTGGNGIWLGQAGQHHAQLKLPGVKRVDRLFRLLATANNLVRRLKLQKLIPAQ